MIQVLLLVGSAVLIYFSCEWFVNAVEWLGRRLKVGPLAVGTILAAIGTALPESAVTLVAALGGDDSKEIAVGAALGGPLVLATIAYMVVGLVLLLSRRRPSPAEYGSLPKLRRDQTWFLVIFVCKVALGLVAFAFKPWLGFAFFAAYAVYFWSELRPGAPRGRAVEEHPDEHRDEIVDLEPLRLHHRAGGNPSNVAIAIQTVITVALIFLASQVFVRQLDSVGPMIGLPATVTALLLSPVATELPETLNAIIWVRQGKTKLALANISGAMMIQATVPSGLGLLFTPWRFDRALTLAGLLTIGAILYLLRALQTGVSRVALLCAGLFYVLFAAGVAVLVS